MKATMKPNVANWLMTSPRAFFFSSWMSNILLDSLVDSRIIFASTRIQLVFTSTRIQLVFNLY